MASNIRRGTIKTQGDLAKLASDPTFLEGFDRASLSRVDLTPGGVAAIVDLGQAVIRSDDFLSINFSLINLDVVAAQDGGPATLQPKAGKTAYIVLRFAPQSISEEAFYQILPSDPPIDPNFVGPSDPNAGQEDPRKPPVKSRIANGSRAVFRFDAKALAAANMASVPYTLQGILDACMHLPLSITANAARAPVRRLVIGPLSGVLLKRQRAAYARLSPGEQARTLSAALRNLRIVQNAGAGAAHLLMRRAELRADALTLNPSDGAIDNLANAVSPATAQHQSLHSSSAMATYGVIGAAGLQVVKTPSVTWRIAPGPVAPTATQTALELPYRLLLSPNETGRMLHASTARVFAPTGNTPLWHSRLAYFDDKTGVTTEGPGSGTELRAIWARVGPESIPKTFNGNYPQGDRPQPGNTPFRQVMDDFDRFEIVHESSNFRIRDGLQEPIACNRLMLSALGGWLDVHGGWKVPAGFSVEQWVHQATQARDHYVKVVYKGYLLPFGHPASLVKVTERKFHHDKPGNPAYLRQRQFLIVREPLVTFPTMTLPATGPRPDRPQNFTRYYHRQFFFTQIKCLTHVTPDLMDAASTDVNAHRQLMFWPCIPSASGAFPFKFSYVGTDLDGHEQQFDLAAMFIGNGLANPANDQDRHLAENYFKEAQTAYWAKGPDYRGADFKQQRVTVAPSLKSGDTVVELGKVMFGAEVEQLRLDPATRTGPLIYPMVDTAETLIPSLAYLTSNKKPSVISMNGQFIARRKDFDIGEVFADVKPNGPVLDFTSQGNRSGGFVQPNLAPTGLSRLAGPISGLASDFNTGTFDGGKFFESVSPLLFGCIPLGELLKALSFDTSKLDKLPKFVTEAMDAAQTFFSALGQANDLVGQLETMARAAAEAALQQAIKIALDQLKPQIQALDAATSAISNQIDQVSNAADALINAIHTTEKIFEPPHATLNGVIGNVESTLDGLLNAVNQRISQLPASGLSTAVQNVVSQQLVPIRTRIAQIQAIVDDLKQIPALLGPAGQLYDAISAFLVPPDQLADLLKDEGQLQSKIQAVGTALGTFQTAFDTIQLFAGAVRGTIVKIATTLRAITDKAADIAQLLSSLLGDEITIKFDWNPTIQSWPQPGNALYSGLGTLFLPHNPDAFVVGVEAKIKKSSGEAKVNVLCGLKAFDLILLGDKHSFMKLVFEKIEFRADSSAKMDVDVKFDGIHFLGPLKFVETLKDLIPLDGFSDPPALSISEKGIDASFSMALPSLAVGVLNLSNLSLGAGFTVPFIGQPLSVRFNFCTREQPFCLTVSMFGGGGFFGITIDPHGVQLMEAAFEFGAAIAVDFGVASGGVHVMAGIYFRMEQDKCTLTGYFRMGGEVSVLGIISVSIELYLALSYESDTGKAKGEATLTISVSVFMFSVSASIHCERKFAGSNGDPSFAALMGPDSGPVTDTTTYPWRDYVEAFA
ncbi:MULTISPECIES: hypothetical protein [Dyella]|uniref:Uncharacterized protein n=2 Tax=Dyella TaxID=231454 RepID=A0A4R0YTT3_9GAMM|nr:MULTISPECIES: hypothetical protein [Dyella]TBR39613.1 hypothetical protein EYV96_05275 [Dyella terrae]TCI12805.1 hypothetical protein EZM97_05595 [Dyella soli]